jgi:hypothetical protein
MIPNPLTTISQNPLDKTQAKEPAPSVCWALPPGTGTMALDPTFGSLTLLEPVFLVKVFRLFKLERIFLVFSRVWTQQLDVQNLIYWQGQRVCDGLL